MAQRQQNRAHNRIVKNMLDILTKMGFSCFDIQANMNYEEDLGYTNALGGRHLEFDIIGWLGDIGIILEVTTDNSNNISKARRVYGHFNDFLSCPNFESVDLKRNLMIRICEKCNIEINDFQNFLNVRNWKYIYLSTGNEMIFQSISNDKVRRNPNEPIYILNGDQYEYIKNMSGLVGSYSKFEFLNFLDITPFDIDQEIPDTIVERCLYINNRIITPGMNPADIVVFSIKVSDLLQITRVFRYGALDAWKPDQLPEGYQRLLKKEKLSNLREHIRNSYPNITFPNTITVLLRKDDVGVDVDNNIIEIKKTYGSIDVIDGQHRLFAFTDLDESRFNLESIRIYVLGIIFREDDDLKKWSAKLFVDINENQTPVPTDLMYFIGYSALKENKPEYLITHVISKLNSKESGPLSNIFKTRPFVRKNRLNSAPIRITTIVNELAKLFSNQNNFTENAWNDYENNLCEIILSEIEEIINRFFSQVRRSFNIDWNDSKSLLYSTKYFAAFSKLLVNFKEINLTNQQIQNELNRIKDNIIDHLDAQQIQITNNDTILRLDYGFLPGKTNSVPIIYGFLNAARTSNNLIPLLQ